MNEFWFVNYDDGDEEEFEQEEFKAVQRLYRKHKDKDPRVRQLAKEKKERRGNWARSIIVTTQLHGLCFTPAMRKPG